MWVKGRRKAKKLKMNRSFLGVTEEMEQQKSRCGYKGQHVIMRMFCSISWLSYSTIVLHDVTIGGKW